MNGTAQVWIAAPHDVVYAAVAELRRMGEWSPENQGGEWLDASEIAVGATFRGQNRNGPDAWHTDATIIEVEPGRAFAFRIAKPGEAGTEWRFRFDPDGDGTTVTETFAWRWTAVPDEGFRVRVGRLPLTDAVAVCAARENLLQAGITATLAAIKRSLEASG